VALLGDDPVDAHLEQILDAGRHEDVAAVVARGDDRPAQPGVARGVQVADRALVRLDAVVVDEPQHELVLGVAQPVERLRCRRVVGRPLRQLDPARGEEVAHAVQAGLAVDVLVVVAMEVELGLAARRQKRVEHLLPRARVHLGGLRENAVEVEQAGRDPVREAEHGF
jgi:hypothetical protein